MKSDDLIGVDQGANIILIIVTPSFSMHLLSCAGRKKKHPKFQLVELFRHSKKPTTKQQSELVFIDRFAEELSKPIVSYNKIQNLAWKGIPACTISFTQASVLKSGNTSSNIC